MGKKNLVQVVFLLLFSLFFSFDRHCRAQDQQTPTSDEPELAVFAEVLNDAPMQNEPFAVSILVDYPNPAEVRVQPPDFEDRFTLERLRTDIRLIRDASNEEKRWTSFEFLLVPIQSGNLLIGSFEVAVPGKTRATNYLRVRAKPTVNEKNGRLRWIGKDILSRTPASIVIGKSAEAGLQLLDWKSTKPFPRDLPLRIEAPENAIIEDRPVAASERELGVVFRVRFVPLDEKPINIAGYTFRYDGRTLEVPPLKMVVLSEEKAADTPADKNEADKIIEDKLPDDEPHIIAAPPIFPHHKFKKPGLPFIKNAVFETYGKAEKLWGNRRYSESLFVLRQGERELSGGIYLAPVRKEAENLLGLPPAKPEKWRPYLLLFRAAVVSFVVLILLIVVYFIFKKKSTLVRVNFACFFMIFITLSALLVVSRLETGKKAVMSACSVSPVPEMGQNPSAYLLEGQNVSVRSKSGEWIYIESYDGKAGWVNKDNAIFY